MSEDAATKLKALYGALTAAETMRLQPIVDLAIEVARPQLLAQEMEKARAFDPVLRCLTFRAPVGTIDEMHAALDREFMRAIGELYLDDKVVPADAVHAEISIEFLKG